MQQKLLMIKGLNTDVSPEFMVEGEGRYRLNVRVVNSENGQDQSAETVKGNTLVSFSLPSGNNTVIGSKEYPLTKKSYHFVYNSSLNHSILEYDSVANTISTVFLDGITGNQPNILNFQLDHLITGINIIKLEEGSHLLYWTDNYNEPRKINIEKGKLYISSAGANPLGYQNSTGAVTGFDPLIINRIKQPPLSCPEYTWGGTEPDIPQFAVDESSPQAVPNDSAVHIVEYDNIISNPFGAFNNTPGFWEWTVGVTDVYFIHTETYLNALAPPNDTLYGIGIVKNGTVVLASITKANVVSGNVALDVFSALLTAGDKVRVEVLNATTAGGFPITMPILGTLFEATSVGIANKGLVNHLFKKMFQFKVQFGFDDFEVSSWSPISKYYFPETINSSPTDQNFDDIIYQSNVIDITVPTGSSIVKKIRIAGKEENDLEFSLIAELDKSLLQLSDNSTTVYKFLNDGSYLPLYINESIKLFDNVPKWSQAQELIVESRLCDGLVTEGFDPVSIDLTMALSYDTVNPLSGNPHFPDKSYLKSGGTYTLGIVYYDLPGNRSGVTNITKGQFDNIQLSGCFGTTLSIPFITDINYNPLFGGVDQMEFVPIVTTEIHNEAPSWASHYQILRSKNQGIRKYIQFAAKNVAHVGTNILIDISNIYVDYKTQYPLSTLVYDFTKGDRIRFISNRVSSDAIDPVPFPFNDTEILSFVPATGIITINDAGVPAGLNVGVLFEIYTPRGAFVADDELMYEVCEEGTISFDTNSQKYVHSGDASVATNAQVIAAFTSATYGTPPTFNATLPVGHGLLATNKVKIIAPAAGAFAGYSVYGVVASVTGTSAVITTTTTLVGTFNGTLTGTISKSATAVLTSGDCFRRIQDNTYTSNTLRIYVEASNVSNMFVSNAWDYGRPNRIDPNFRQVTRPSTIFWSEAFISETSINGLSTVYDTNFQTYEDKYGNIKKLYNENFNLICFQQLKVSNIPISQNIFSGTQGDKVVGSSTEILSQIAVYYAGELGLSHPESFAVYGKAKYGIDVYRGVIWRLSNDGMIPISDSYNVHNYISQKCKDVQNYTGIPIKITGVFDIRFSEYIISFHDVSSPLFVGATLAFNEDANVWTTFYSYLPEMMCGNGVDIISFKNGSLYTHNSNSVYNNFYGVQYKSNLWFYCNALPSNEKVFEAISLESLDTWDTTIETPISIENPAGQTTSMIANNYQYKENVFYSEILKDDNTPNIVASPPLLPNARFEGNVLRAPYALIKLEYQSPIYCKILACNIRFIPSQRSNM